MRGADAFALFLNSWRQQHIGVGFTDRGQAVDGEHGRTLWDIEVGDKRAGGVNVFNFAPDGRIKEVWSLAAHAPGESGLAMTRTP